MITADNRVTWKTFSLGHHAFVVFSYEGNNETRIIPRAKGAIIHSTKEMGGGILKIEVKAFVALQDRLALETFFAGLDGVYDLTEPGTLTIDGSLSLTNCYLESFSQGSEDFRFSEYTFQFVKSL